MNSHTILQHKSLIEILFKIPLTYSQLKVFGYLCFPNTKPYNHHKLQFWSIPCIFIGYSLNHKGYRCLDIFERIFISHDVNFDKHVFPFAQSSSPTQSICFNPTQSTFFLFFLLLLYPSNLFCHSLMLLIIDFIFLILELMVLFNLQNLMLMFHCMCLILTILLSLHHYLLFLMQVILIKWPPSLRIVYLSLKYLSPSVFLLLVLRLFNNYLSMLLWRMSFKPYKELKINVCSHYQFVESL